MAEKVISYLKTVKFSSWDFTTCINIIKEDLNCDNEQAYAHLDNILKQQFESNSTIKSWIKDWKNLIKKYEKSNGSVAGPSIQSQTNINTVNQMTQNINTPVVGTKRQKSTIDDPFDSEPIETSFNQRKSFIIEKKPQVYQFSTPSTFISSPNKPTIQSDDREKLKQYFDICIKSDKSFLCSDGLKKQFDTYNIDNNRNASLNRHQHELDWLRNIFKIEFENFLEDTIILSKKYSKNELISFMKYTFIDFHANCQRPVPVPINNERTIYVEFFIPMFKYFANFTKTLAFTWCEKQLNSSSIWYMLSDYSKPGINRKFVDGIGTDISSSKDILIIESSGYNDKEDFKHMLEDTLKNLKNGSDSLKYLISQYKFASYSTFKKVTVFSIQIIQTTMTLVAYSVSTPEKWQAVECRSASVPLTWDDREDFIKVFELFTFLLEELKNQKENFKALKQEHLGISFVTTGQSVEDILVHNLKENN
ncbi:hypothetical protein BDF21DRAFT_369139 [Thamnidium elegans]|nr:hypothetical protein BDF21DRAFT_369139 [Thamnidium elegans]